MRGGQSQAHSHPGSQLGSGYSHPRPCSELRSWFVGQRQPHFSKAAWDGEGQGGGPGTEKTPEPLIQLPSPGFGLLTSQDPGDSQITQQ